jgi:hypothetical protein
LDIKEVTEIVSGKNKQITGSLFENVGFRRQGQRID